MSKTAKKLMRTDKIIPKKGKKISTSKKGPTHVNLGYFQTTHVKSGPERTHVSSTWCTSLYVVTPRVTLRGHRWATVRDQVI